MFDSLFYGFELPYNAITFSPVFFLIKAAFDFGYQDVPFTLDESTSSNDIMFMERASPGAIATSLNAGDFRSNVGVRNWDDRYWVGAYFTGPSQGQAHNLTAEQYGAFQRATYQVLKGDDAVDALYGQTLREMMTFMQENHARSRGPSA